MSRTVPLPAAAGAFWTGELDYHLPEERIAQTPASRRERSRLMVVDRGTGVAHHAVFADLADFLPPRALLVGNDSRVIPARLRGRKTGSGGSVEVLVLSMGDASVAHAIVRAAKPVREGQVIELDNGICARVVSPPEQGRAYLDFAPLGVTDVLERCGELPLPPYIDRAGGPTDADRERYQTVYAEHPGSVAAPTAGLHFTQAMLDELSARGLEFTTLTLHVGPGTFTPVRGELATHEMEEERYDIVPSVAARIEAAGSAGRPVVAIGTTTVRALETAAVGRGRVTAGKGCSRLFIRPGHQFQIVDALVTNFHLPGSTLLALVMALAGRDAIRSAYEEAVREGYRFYSYGDAMLIR